MCECFGTTQPFFRYTCASISWSPVIRRRDRSSCSSSRGGWSLRSHVAAGLPLNVCSGRNRATTVASAQLAVKIRLKRRAFSSPFSTERLTLTRCRSLLDRVQHPMARDRVVERGAKMRSVAIVAGETRVRLGDVGGRAVQRREPVLRRHGQDLEGGLRPLAATDGQLEDLGLAAVSRNLEVGLGAVDLPKPARAPPRPA